MNNVVSFASYVDEHLYYVKTNIIDGNELRTVIRINKKMISQYDTAVIRERFNPLDFNPESLGDYLLENSIRFKIFFPLKNTKGFYKRHFPDTQSYMDHYDFQDDKNPLEKRDVRDFDYVDTFNKKIIGLHGYISSIN